MKENNFFLLKQTALHEVPATEEGKSFPSFEVFFFFWKQTAFQGRPFQ